MSDKIQNTTVWKVSKYGPEKNPYRDIFHAVYVSLLLADFTVNIPFEP